MSYMHEADQIAEVLVSGLLGLIPSGALSLMSYVLTSLAIYTLARRRGLRHPWLAWVPVANNWLIGSLSDQFRYLTRGENKSKRKSLLVLGILSTALSAALIALFIAMVAQTVIGYGYGMDSDAMAEGLIGLAMGILGLCLPMLAVIIAYVIIRYMALYDIYKSMDPGNSVLFLLLSILFSVTEPFFLFFSRNKDLGMPPRRRPEAGNPQEPWEDAGKEYL